MTPKDDLHRLIQALSPKERQTFAIAAKGTKKEDPVYLQLFHALCDLDAYHEPTFLVSRQGAPFKSNFSVRKKELLDKILQVLRSQRQSAGADKPMEFQVREEVEDARILRDKKLLDMSRQRLKHARTEAEKYQFHEILLEILRMERTILLDSQEPDFLSKVNALHREIEETTRIIHNKYRMLYLRDQLFLPTRRHAELSGQLDWDTLQSLMQSEELKNVALCLSFEAMANYHFCHTIYQHFLGNPEGAWIHMRSIYLMWQEQKGMQKIRAVDYRNMLQNYLILCSDVGKFDDFEVALAQLEKGPFTSDEERAASIQNSQYVRLQKHLEACEWENATKVFEEFMKTREAFGERMSPSRMMTFYLSFSRLFLILEDRPKAVTWARKVILEGEGDSNKGLVLQARLQELFALFDMNAVAEMEKQSRVAVQSLRKANANHEVEIKIAQTLNRMIGQQNRSNVLKAFEALLSFSDNHSNTRITKDRYVRAFILSKVQGKTFKETIMLDLIHH